MLTDFAIACTELKRSLVVQVSNPMDLGTVEMKLITHKYASPMHFAADVRLVFQNAMVFNEAEDPVHQVCRSHQSPSRL